MDVLGFQLRDVGSVVSMFTVVLPLPSVTILWPGVSSMTVSNCENDLGKFKITIFLIGSLLYSSQPPAQALHTSSCTRYVFHEDTCKAPQLVLRNSNDVISPISADTGYYTYKTGATRTKRNALQCQKWLWPSGVVPFWFTVRNSKIAKRFGEAIREFNALNCVQFVSLNEMINTKRSFGKFPRRFLVIVESEPYPGSRCRATVGTTSINPKMQLSTVCTKGQILHELMHVIGFSHEHMRPDRDQYIQVNCENIFPNVTGDFRKLRANVVQTFDEPYDFSSIMHYKLDHFSRNGMPTITPLVPVNEGKRIGSMESFSDSDVRRIKRLYNCPHE